MTIPPRSERFASDESDEASDESGTLDNVIDINLHRKCTSCGGKKTWWHPATGVIECLDCGGTGLARDQRSVVEDQE